MAMVRLQNRIPMEGGVQVETAATAWPADTLGCRVRLDPDPARWAGVGSNLGVEIQASYDGGATWRHWLSTAFSSGPRSGKGADEQWAFRELGRQTVGDQIAGEPAPTHLRAVMECRADPTTCGLEIEWIAGTVAPSRLHHSVAFVQSTGKFGENGGDGVIAATFGSTPTAGNFIGVVTWSYSSGAAVGYAAGSVSDNKSNSYTQAVENEQAGGGGDNFGSAIYSSANIVSSATFTVTIDITSTSAHLIAAAAEFSGVATSAALDKTGTSNATGGSPTSGNSGTLAQADELVLVVSFFGTGDSTTSISAEAGYTQLAEETNDAVSQAGESDYKIVAATTAEECTWTVANAATIAGGCIATFKGAGAGTTVRSRSLTMTGCGA
jgi:hypothetical protein